MKIDNEMLQYMRGKSFNAGYQMKLEKNDFVLRNNLLLKITRGGR